MKRRIFSTLLVVVFALQLMVGVVTAGAQESFVNQSKMLKTLGNKVVWADDESHEVFLAGLNPYAYDLTKEYERMDRSFIEALDNWHVNTIRFPITSNLWSNPRYKELLQHYVDETAQRGKYIIIDLHNFGFIKQADVDFWMECAEIYKNNPAVLFGILNEPHSTTWEQWRNGGGEKYKSGEEMVAPIGHQTLVEKIRDLGAKNIIIAGGLDWAYDLRGLVGELPGDKKIYALDDQGSKNDKSKTGNGIIYDTHIYPWKGMEAWTKMNNRDNVDPLKVAVDEWIEMIGGARKKFPVLSGENGWDAETIRFIFGTYLPAETVELLMDNCFQPGQRMYHDLWNKELFKFLYDEQTYGAKINYTAWCFAPNSSPVLIGDKPNWGKPDYSYPESPFWGAYVKDEMKRILGINLITGKKIVDAEGFDNAQLAIDADYTTVARNSDAGSKHITVDLGENYTINKWAVRHSGSMLYSDQSKNTVDFDLMYSADGENWEYADKVAGNLAPVTEREIQPVKARFVRLDVTKAAQSDNTARIYDFAVYSGRGEDVSSYPTMDKAFMQINYSAQGEQVTANVNYPLYNRTESPKEYTLVTGVFNKDGSIADGYPVQVYKKTVAPASGNPNLEDITLNFNAKLPNDDQHVFKILHYDPTGKGMIYKYDTIIRK